MSSCEGGRARVDRSACPQKDQRCSNQSDPHLLHPCAWQTALTALLLLIVLERNGIRGSESNLRSDKRRVCLKLSRLLRAFTVGQTAGEHQVHLAAMYERKSCNFSLTGVLA